MFFSFSSLFFKKNIKRIECDTADDWLCGEWGALSHTIQSTLTLQQTGKETNTKWSRGLYINSDRKLILKELKTFYQRADIADRQFGVMGDIGWPVIWTNRKIDFSFPFFFLCEENIFTTAHWPSRESHWPLSAEPNYPPLVSVHTFDIFLASRRRYYTPRREKERGGRIHVFGLVVTMSCLGVCVTDLVVPCNNRPVSGGQKARERERVPVNPGWSPRRESQHFLSCSPMKYDSKINLPLPCTFFIDTSVSSPSD